jgi:hypothetical protein
MPPRRVGGLFPVSCRYCHEAEESFHDLTVYRVLKPGDRLHMADILLAPQATREEAARKGTWSD